MRLSSGQKAHSCGSPTAGQRTLTPRRPTDIIATGRVMTPCPYASGMPQRWGRPHCNCARRPLKRNDTCLVSDMRCAPAGLLSHPPPEHAPQCDVFLQKVSTHPHAHTHARTHARTHPDHTPTHVGNRKNKNRARKAVGETPQELQSSPRHLLVCQRVHGACIACPCAP